MKKILFATLAIIAFIVASCSDKEDEPEIVPYGYISLDTEFVGDDAPEEPVDISKYVVVIVPEKGWIYAEEWGKIHWPIQAAVGKYSIAISSPIVKETDTEVMQYYGEIEQLAVSEALTTTATVRLSLKAFKKEK